MRIFILTLLSLFISACGVLGTKYPEMHGRVLHEIHDKPIPHTLVVALWKGKEVKDNSGAIGTRAGEEIRDGETFKL